MALETRTQAENADWVLSAEEAERYAALIRPSWEVDLAPDEGGAPEAAAKVSTDEPVVHGIPTIPVGAEAARDVAAAQDAAAAKPEDPGSKALDAPSNGGDVEAPLTAAAAPQPAPQASPGATRSAARASKSSAGATRASRARPADDPIHPPVSGSPKTALLKIAIAVVGVAAIYFTGRAMLGLRDEAATGPTAAPIAPHPTALATQTPAAVPSPTQAATPAPVQPEPALADENPSPTASAAAHAPSATARATATAAAPTRPTAAAAAAPTKTATTAKPVKPPATAKPAATAAAPATTKPPSGAKQGSGIIRDAPF